MADRFDDKAREICNRENYRGHPAVEWPDMERLTAAILRAAVELRAGSDAPGKPVAGDVVASMHSAVPFQNHTPLMEAGDEACRVCAQPFAAHFPRLPDAPASEPATCEGCGCVPCAGNGGECPGKMRRAEPAAVPASPQAETRGDLLERMAGALKMVRAAFGEPHEYIQGTETMEAMHRVVDLLAEYATPPVQGDPPSHTAVAVEMVKRYGAENHGPWCVDAIRVANEMDNTSRRAFVAAAKNERK